MNSVTYRRMESTVRVRGSYNLLFEDVEYDSIIKGVEGSETMTQDMWNMLMISPYVGARRLHWNKNIE